MRETTPSTVVIWLSPLGISIPSDSSLKIDVSLRITCRRRSSSFSTFKVYAAPFSWIWPAVLTELFLRLQCSHSNDSRMTSRKKGTRISRSLVVPYFTCQYTLIGLVNPETESGHTFSWQFMQRLSTCINPVSSFLSTKSLGFWNCDSAALVVCSSIDMLKVLRSFV